MNEEKGIVAGDFVVRDEGSISGIVQGSVTVLSGARLKLKGVCLGDLVAAADTDLQILGVVKGHIHLGERAHLVLRGVCAKGLTIAPGAKVEITGTVSGTVENRGGTISGSGIYQVDQTEG